MFAIKTLVAGETIAIKSPVKAVTTASAKGASGESIAMQNALREYVALQYTGDAIDSELTSRAHAAMKNIADFKTFTYCRDEFKKAYTRDYMARNGAKSDAAKCKSACDMAWSRFVKRAESVKDAKGVQVWTKPVSQTPSAQKSKANRTKSKVNNPTEDKRKTRHVKPDATAPKSAIVQPAIVVHAEKNPELRAALDWVASSGEHAKAFLDWFKTQRARELSPVTSRAA